MRRLVQKVWEQPLYGAALLGALSFPAMVARFMFVYSRNRPVNDDLQHSAPIAVKTVTGTLTWVGLVWRGRPADRMGGYCYGLRGQAGNRNPGGHTTGIV
jgi:hypothetical protein